MTVTLVGPDLDDDEHPIFIQPTAPVTALTTYLWVQTGLGTSGEDCTFWIEDGT